MGISFQTQVTPGDQDSSIAITPGGATELLDLDKIEVPSAVQAILQEEPVQTVVSPSFEDSLDIEKLRVENETLRSILSNLHSQFLKFAAENNKLHALMNQLMSQCVSNATTLQYSLQDEAGVFLDLGNGKTFEEIYQTHTPEETEETVAETEETHYSLTTENPVLQDEEDRQYAQWLTTREEYAQKRASLPKDHPEYLNFEMAKDHFTRHYPYQSVIPGDQVLSPEAAQYYEQLKAETEDPVIYEPATPADIPVASEAAVGLTGMAELLGGTIETSVIRNYLTSEDGKAFGWTVQEHADNNTSIASVSYYYDQKVMQVDTAHGNQYQLHFKTVDDKLAVDLFESHYQRAPNELNVIDTHILSLDMLGRKHLLSLNASLDAYLKGIQSLNLLPRN